LYTYASFHLTFTLAPLLILTLLSTPALRHPSSRSRLLAKLAALAALAVAYTTPWDNYIIWAGAWRYHPSRVAARIGLVPVEEYAFFVVQSIATALFAEAVFAHAHNNKNDLMDYVTCANFWIRWTPIALFFLMFSTGLLMVLSSTSPSTNRWFYLGMIISWVAPVLTLTWWYAGPFIAVRPVSLLVAIAVPTVYLSYADHCALADEVWIISPSSSTGVMVTAHLPLEEALFFLLTNTMLVFGLRAFDRGMAVVDVLLALRRSGGGGGGSQTFSYDECGGGGGAVAVAAADDARFAAACLRAGSKSFSAALCLFPRTARPDIAALYCLCRVCDDIADGPDAAVPATPGAVATEVGVKKMEEEKQEEAESPSPDDVDKVLRNLLRSGVPRCVPFRLVDELLSGFEWDLGVAGAGERAIDTERDLIDYAERVASSVGEAMLRIMWYHESSTSSGSSSLPSSTDDVPDELVLAARDLGVALQCINCARDIVTDANLGRSYLPTAWFPADNDA
ncbi:Squalene/phytoene synthase-domain-containing protein, partial [Zopfochytrium polystomum]